MIGSLDWGAETAVANGLTGILVPQNDHQAVANAVLKLLEDRDLFRKMSAAARNWAASTSMSWDRTIESLMAIYEQILSH